MLRQWYFISYFKNELKNINNKSINFYNADINKIEFSKKYDIILFLAGIATPTIYKKYPIETLDTSFRGLKKNCLDLLKIAKQISYTLAQVKFMEILTKKIFQQKRLIMEM